MMRTKSQEVKPVRKILPYSIKEVRGPEEVKAWQLAAQAKSVAREKSRRDRAIEALTTPPGTFEPTPSKVWDVGQQLRREYVESLRRQQEEYAKAMAQLDARYPDPVPQPSFFARVWAKITNIIMDLPF